MRITTVQVVVVNYIANNILILDMPLFQIINVNISNTIECLCEEHDGFERLLWRKLKIEYNFALLPFFGKRAKNNKLNANIKSLFYEKYVRIFYVTAQLDALT